ncbi:MAG TPA: leucyl aminopeptidase [Lacisediminihabitans sp.]|uniref:leucyl aminopeptidase n=1 Tax=Lacisediminihabitans sp. TaxID=2787631 RepID=UPI002EDBA94F
MTVPALRISADLPQSVSADVLVLGVGTTDLGPRLLSDDPAFDGIRAGLAAIGATGARDELLRLPGDGVAAGGIALVGLGVAEATADSLRYAAGTAARGLGGLSVVAMALPAATEEDLAAILEGAALGAYVYTVYRSASLEATKLPASTVVVVSSVETDQHTDDQLIARASTIATAVHSVRDLVNAPPSDLYPETFAAAIAELASDLPVDLEILDEEALRSGGFGGILGMGAGSTRGPRLVRIDYSPASATRHLALVGKGITFDSGGLSLKQPASMVGMKEDMAGAATVAAVVIAAARLGLDVRLTGWLCIAENMPSGSAIRPNDVVRIRGGKTVEVLNTDAEGRVVMADGLAAASEDFPDAIVDIATLTGAQRVALGDRYSGAMGDEAFVAQVVDAAERVGELLWPMPLPGELRALLNSDVADIANAKIGNTAAGMLLAGVFLREFVGSQRNPGLGRIPWAHLDIAGPASNSGGGYGFTGKGATGVLVRTLIALAEQVSLA